MVSLAQMNIHYFSHYINKTRVILFSLLLILLPICVYTSSVFAADQVVLPVTWDYPNAPPDLKGFILPCWDKNTPGTKIQASIDKNASPWEGQFTFANFPDGDAQCVLYAKDLAGQMSEPTDPVDVNMKPPTPVRQLHTY